MLNEFAKHEPQSIWFLSAEKYRDEVFIRWEILDH